MGWHSSISGRVVRTHTEYARMSTRSALLDGPGLVSPRRGWPPCFTTVARGCNRKNISLTAHFPLQGRYRSRFAACLAGLAANSNSHSSQVARYQIDYQMERWVCRHETKSPQRKIKNKSANLSISTCEQRVWMGFWCRLAHGLRQRCPDLCQTIRRECQFCSKLERLATCDAFGPFVS